MELYQLRAFDAVANEGNLSRAAKLLCASQPAVSAQIKALEDEFGIALFERAPRGMVPTPEGIALLERARAVLDGANLLLSEAHRMRGEPEGVLRIGALPDPEKLRLGTLLKLLAERHPRLRVDLRHAASGSVRREILSGALDAGFVLGPSESGLSRRVLAPMRLVVAFPPDGHVEADSPWERIAELPWIGTPDDCPFQMLGQDLFARMGRSPRVERRVDIERTILEMVSSGLGAGLLREDTALAAARDGRCRIWAGAAIETEFAFVWPRSRTRNPCLDAMRTILDELWPTSR